MKYVAKRTTRFKTHGLQWRRLTFSTSFGPWQRVHIYWFFWVMIGLLLSERHGEAVRGYLYNH